MERLVSVGPDGKEYALPKKEDYEQEFRRISELAASARKNGQEVVVVMGVRSLLAL